MENTIENKVKFITQYWGQKVLKVVPTTTEIVGVGWNLKSPNMYIKLTSLSKISDEDAIVVAEVVTTHENQAEDLKAIKSEVVDRTDEKVLVARGDVRVHIYYTGLILVSDSSVKNFAPALNTNFPSDYFRSKGYLMPFHDLKPEQIIEYGWAKIQ